MRHRNIVLLHIAAAMTLTSLTACSKKLPFIAPTYPSYSPPIGAPVPAYDRDPTYGCEPDRMLPGDEASTAETLVFDEPTELEWMGEELVHGHGPGYILVRHEGRAVWIAGNHLSGSRRQWIVTLLAHDAAASSRPACWHARLERFADGDRAILTTPSRILLVDLAARRYIFLDTLGSMLEGCSFNRSRTSYTCNLDMMWESVSIDANGESSTDSFRIDATWK